MGYEFQQVLPAGDGAVREVADRKECRWKSCRVGTDGPILLSGTQNAPAWNFQVWFENSRMGTCTTPADVSVPALLRLCQE